MKIKIWQKFWTKMNLIFLKVMTLRSKFLFQKKLKTNKISMLWNHLKIKKLNLQNKGKKNSKRRINNQWKVLHLKLILEVIHKTHLQPSIILRHSLLVKSVLLNNWVMRKVRLIQGLGLINIFNQLLFSLMLQKKIKKKNF